MRRFVRLGLAVAIAAAGCAGSGDDDDDVYHGRPGWRDDLTATCRFAAKQRGWQMFGPENVRSLGGERWAADVVVSVPRDRKRAAVCEYDMATGTAEIIGP
jgi:hypothetical protein